jgi:phosphatidylserine/phosphatidylglycerophosphate/cardiolipin synthase-like enzyme
VEEAINRQRQWTLAAIVLLLAAMLACDLLPPPTPTLPPILTGSWYQLHFTAPKYPDKEADHRGGLDEKLTALIQSARTSVDVAVYQLDLPNVTQALLDAKKRGATVRVVTDIDIYNDPKENPSFKQLEKVGIKVVGGNSYAIMHNKFVVVDRAAVWTGSWNFTESETYRNNNNAIVIQSPELALNYIATFEKMFNGKAFGSSRKPGGTTPRLSIGGVRVENYFSPEDQVTNKIITRLKQATRTIDFMAFSFTEDSLGRVVIERAQAGVRVRGVFESSNENAFSEYGKMKQAGLEVWLDGNSYTMHHKVFILDGQTVVFGSFNFSSSAEEDNDENLLIVDDAGLAQTFTAEFERVLAQAKNPPKK